MLASDWADGGVECEGRSYKALAQRAKEKMTLARAVFTTVKGK